MIELPANLADYTDQEIQLALMARSSGDWFDPKETIPFYWNIRIYG